MKKVALICIGLVCRHYYSWESVYQRVESQRIRAELVEQRRSIDADRVHYARRE